MQIVEKMAAAAAGQEVAPLYAYSGHDTTIMPVLATLGIQLRDWPEYVSNVVSTHGAIRLVLISMASNVVGAVQSMHPLRC